MATKKKYPEPYRREDSKIYYFNYLGKDGKRRRLTTGLTGKEEAREYIRSFVDEQGAEATTLTFAEYAAPYFKSETCPHFIRYRQEGRASASATCTNAAPPREARLQGPGLFRLPMNKIKRGDLLDLRRRLHAAGLG